MITGRSVTLSTHGMVSSSHYLASLVGVKILQEGGNAIDAAIATNAVLNVTLPESCGFGGDAFMLIYLGKTGELKALNASGRAPYAATREFFRSKGIDKMPSRGIYPVTVPGVVDGWITVYEKYGTIPFHKLLEPAIGYAEEGFPVSHKVSQDIKSNLSILASYPSSAKILLNNGKPLEPGEILRQKDLANTFRKIAEGGREAFYRGDIARAIVKFSQDNQGLLAEKDFADHHADWTEPVSTWYRGYQVYVHPPNSQGWTLLSELNILEGINLASLGYHTPEHLHYLVEAKKLAFADRDRYNTDPDFVKIPLEQLLSKDYATQRRAKIDPNRAKESVQPGSFEGNDTTYFSVADKEGNLVSCIQSLYYAFGSGMVAEGTGLFLQNRGAYFSLDENHVNRLEPHKRTAHTLIPGMVFKDNKPFMVIGTRGGDGQAQILLQIITNVIDFGMNIQESLEAPRWIHGRMFPGEAPVLHMEDPISPETRRHLEQKGHQIKTVEAWDHSTGTAQGILLDPVTQVLQGGSDPRGDGVALGW